MRLGDWFLTAAERRNDATRIDRRRGDDRAWTEGNLVEVLVDGEEYFRRLHVAVVKMNLREIVPNELIVCTEVFEGMAESEPAVCTYTFTLKNERTTVTLVIELASKETRDAIINSGMEKGMQAG